MMRTRGERSGVPTHGPPDHSPASAVALGLSTALLCVGLALVGCGDEVEESPTPAELLATDPAAGAEILKGGIVELVFDKDPGRLEAIGGTVGGAGAVRTVTADTDTIVLSWDHGGTETLTFALEVPDTTGPTPDTTGPTLTRSAPADGAPFVESETVNARGVILEFDEGIVKVVLELQSGGVKIGNWTPTTSGPTVVLRPTAGAELVYETEYEVVGTVVDAAGNETEVDISFTTTRPGGPDCADRPPTAGLLSLHMFDDDGGAEAEDSSANENHGVLVAAVDWVDGHFGGAVEIHGGKPRSHIVVPHRDLLNVADALTVAAWIRIHDMPDEHGAVLSKDNAYAVPLLVDDDGGVRVGLTVWSGGDVATVWTAAIGRRRWQHVAAVYDGGDLRVYVGGELEGRKPHNGRIDASDADIIIGRDAQGGRAHIEIDELAIWGAALDGQDILPLLCVMGGWERPLPVQPNTTLTTIWSDLKRP